MGWPWGTEPADGAAAGCPWCGLALHGMAWHGMTFSFPCWVVAPWRKSKGKTPNRGGSAASPVGCHRSRGRDAVLGAGAGCACQGVQGYHCEGPCGDRGGCGPSAAAVWVYVVKITQMGPVGQGGMAPRSPSVQEPAVSVPQSQGEGWWWPPEGTACAPCCCLSCEQHPNSPSFLKLK